MKEKILTTLALLSLVSLRSDRPTGFSNIGTLITNPANPSVLVQYAKLYDRLNPEEQIKLATILLPVDLAAKDPKIFKEILGNLKHNGIHPIIRLVTHYDASNKKWSLPNLEEFFTTGKVLNETVKQIGFTQDIIVLPANEPNLTKELNADPKLLYLLIKQFQKGIEGNPNIIVAFPALADHTLDQTDLSPTDFLFKFKAIAQQEQEYHQQPLPIFQAVDTHPYASNSKEMLANESRQRNAVLQILGPAFFSNTQPLAVSSEFGLPPVNDCLDQKYLSTMLQMANTFKNYGGKRTAACFQQNEIEDKTTGLLFNSHVVKIW